MSHENMITGCVGWLHKPWFSHFYPEDMPEEWALTYYSNEFNAVVVPEAYWQAGDGFEIEDWLDDVHESFRFYLQFPQSLAARAAKEQALDFDLFIEQAEQVKENLGGILLAESTRFEASDLEKLKACAPVFSFDQDPVEGVYSIWQPDKVCASSLAWIDRSLEDMKQARKWLESFAADSSKGSDMQQVVIHAHSEPKVEAMQQFKTLVELMGL